MAGENTPTTVPTSVDAEYGIATTISGYTIESFTYTEGAAAALACAG